MQGGMENYSNQTPARDEEYKSKLILNLLMHPDHESYYYYHNNTVISVVTDSTVTDENDNNILIVAVVSATLATFLLTFIFTFILGCTCGICCCRKKCNKTLRDSTVTAVYEDVIPTGGRQQEPIESLALQQNVAYVSAVASSNP